MAVTATPTTVAHRDEGFLSAGISASATTITVGAIYKTVSGVKTKQGFDTTAGFAEISQGDAFEIISFDSVSVNATTKVTTLTGVRRGLSVNATTQSLSSGTGKLWPKGARIAVVDSANYIQATAFKDKANTFTEDQTIESGNKVILGGSSAYVWSENSGTDLKFKDANNSEKTLSQLAAAGGSDEKAAIDASATAGYLGAASSDGILRTDASLSYTDGGDFVTLGVAAPLNVATGGTGATSLTAYAPVFGGTTSTGAVQSGTVGSSGQLLTSNGAGALPTFQTFAQDWENRSISVADSTVVGASSTAEANMNVNYTITANDWAAGAIYKLSASIKSTIDNTGGSDTVTIRIKLGTTTVGSYTYSRAANIGDHLIEYYIVCRTTGASGTVQGHGFALGGTNVTRGVVANSTTTIDTTASQVLQVSAQIDTNSANHAFNIENFIVTKLV